MTTRVPASPPQIAGFGHIRLLGSGGFADVYLFQQDMPYRQVAVKVLHKTVNAADSADLAAMFRFEMDAMGRLGPHPAILTVHHAGISADGRPYLVMEHCPDGLGRSWRNSPLPASDVVHIGVKLASALETAHRAQVLHRDIKPSNVLFTEYGHPVLADFGISGRLTGSGDSDVIAMSIPWSAPEVIRQETSGTVASEIWSLGATLYSLLAGRTPFQEVGEKKSPSTDKHKERILRANYTPIGRADVPEELERVLLKTMWKDPTQRYESMLELAMELNRVQGDMGDSLTPIELPTNPWTQFDPVSSSARSSAPPLAGGSVVPVESKRRRAQS